VLAAVVLFVLAGLLAGQLRGSSTTSVGLGAPANPFTGGSSASASAAAPAVTGNSGLSSSDVASIASKVNKGVVDINTELGYQDGEAAGTGMVLTASGDVLTNNHVIAGATKITATVVATGRTYTAHVVGTAPTEDVAVIHLDGASSLSTITASKSNVSVGDPVVASGNAGGKGGAPSVTAGNIVAVGQTITASDDNGANAQRLGDLIQFDATIAPGDSGGPLANRAGEVIGMNSAAEVSGARFSSTSTSGYAIPISKALTIAGQIESGAASSTVHIGLPAFLGVQIAGNGNGNGAGRLGRGGVPATATAAAVVSGVVPGTPAASLGLTPGDTVTSVNGTTVTSGSTLTTVLQTQRPGDQVTIGWTDASGRQHSARTTLIAGPAD
jgi:S1-C subfamily serine protease